MVFHLAADEAVGMLAQARGDDAAARARIGGNALNLAVEIAPHARNLRKHRGTARGELFKRHRRVAFAHRTQLAVSAIGPRGARHKDASGPVEREHVGKHARRKRACVKAGVERHHRDARFDGGPHHRARRHRRRGAGLELAWRIEECGMVRHKHVRAARCRLVNRRNRGVERYRHARDLTRWIAHRKARPIPVFNVFFRESSEQRRFQGAYA